MLEEHEDVLSVEITFLAFLFSENKLVINTASESLEELGGN